MILKNLTEHLLALMQTIQSVLNGSNRGLLGLFAISAVIFSSELCFAQTAPPLNLSARAAPGGVELLFNFSYQSAGLAINRFPAWAAGQNLQLFSLFFQDGNLQPDSGGGIDPYVTAGTTYTYNVVYPNSSIKGSVSIRYIPACSFVGHCPTGGQPPQYTINCQQPADFFTSPTAPAAATKTTSFTGVGTVFPSSAAVTYACIPAYAGGPFGGAPASLCSAFSQIVNVSSCSIPPAPPPINNCKQCIATGRKCVRSGNGFVCVGNLQ